MIFTQNFPFFSIFLMIICAVACLLLKEHYARRLSLFCISATTALSAAVLIFTLQTGESFTYMMGYFPSPFGNEIRVGAFEAFMSLLFCSVSFLSAAGSLQDITRDVPAGKTNQYFLMQNMMLGSMLAVIYSNDIFTAFVFIEIITITASAVVTAKPGGRTLAAAVKYLIISLAGSSLLLLSIAILYGVTGHLLLEPLGKSVASLVAGGEYTLPLFVLTALLTSGLAIKSALFPFHSWLPDAHAGATTGASAILSGLVIKCYLILLVKLNFRVFSLGTIEMLRINHILFVFGTAGIIYGFLKAIAQKNIKRMLSFASIAQIGFICVAIGMNTVASIAAACFHIAVHAAGKAMLFTATGGLARVSGHRKDFESLKGSAHRDPLSGAAFILGGLTMIGIPPFAGFFSKLYLSQAAFETPFVVPVVLIAVISSIMSSMYYFPAIVCILSKLPESAAQTLSKYSGFSLSYQASLITFMAITLFFSFFSQQILDVIEQGLVVLG